jgi:transmembrane sensor
MDNFSDKSYEDFDEADFICDPYFQEWLIHPDNENEQFWTAFIESYPGKKKVLEKARLLLKSLPFKEEFPEEERIQQRFEEHLKAVRGSNGVKVVPFNTRLWKTVAKIAAVVGGIVILTSILLLMGRKASDAVIATSYGEMKEIVLPDSTHIVLNAHSKITYSKKWEEKKSREVWLEGEAFFDVKHLNRNEKNIQPGERFLVHVNDASIEVLGTSFNVRQRRGTIEVVLQSGKIKLSVLDKEITMKPGDWIVYNPGEKTIIRSETVAENYSAWKEKKLMLNNPTVEQIVNYLEDSYGKRIVLDNPELLTKKIEGPILLNNLDDALFVISTVLNVKVEHKDSVLILHSK